MNFSKYISLNIVCLLILIQLSFVSSTSIIDDTNSEFNQGNYFQTTSYSGNVLIADKNSDNYYSDGNYFSQIFDLGNSVRWKTFRWSEAESYGGTYPDNAEDGDFNMVGNVLLYHFNETSGSSVNDSSGHGNNAIISNGGVSFNNNADFGTAFGFDGNASYVSVSNSSDLSFQNSWSIEAWVNRSEFGRYQVLFSKSSLTLGIGADDRPFIEVISSVNSDSNLRLMHSISSTACNLITAMNIFKGNMYLGQSGNGNKVLKYTKDTNSWSDITGVANAPVGITYRDGTYFNTATSVYKYNSGSSVSSITSGSGGSGVAMTSYGGNLYTIRGQNLYRCSASACNTLIYTNTYNQLATLAVYRNKLYLFSGNVGGSKVFEYDGSSVTEVTAAGVSSGRVEATAVYNDVLYIGKYNGFIATYDGTTWSGFTSNTISGIANIRNLAVYNDKLYAVVDSTNGTKLYQYNGSSFSQVGATQSRNLTSLLVYDGKLYIGADGGSTTSCYLYAYGQGSTIYSNTDISQGNSHIVATFDVDTNTLKLYLNGSLVGSQVINVLPENNTKASYIGKGYGSNFAAKSSYGEDTFKGYIDEFAIYNRSLSQTDITQRYNSIIMDLKFKVRACSTPNCSDSNFSGPGGDQSQYFNAGSVNYDISHLLDSRYFQYFAEFSTADTLKTSSKNPTLNDVNITYNNSPDINITGIRVDNNSGLGYISYFREGILKIDFNVIDLDNDNLYITSKYGTSNSYSGATVQMTNTPLSSICGVVDYSVIVSCTYDFNLYGISTHVEYQDIYIFLNVTDLDYNDTSYIGTIRIDNTPQSPIANIISLYNSDGNLNFGAVSYELDNSLEFDFNIYDFENDATELDFFLRKVSTFTYYNIKQDIDLDNNLSSSVGNLNLFYCNDTNLQRTPQCKINFSLQNIPDGNYNLYLVFNDISGSQEIVQYTTKVIIIDNTPPDLNIDYDNNWTQETIEDIIVDGWIVNTVDENESCNYDYQCRIYGPNYDTNNFQDTGWYSCRGYFYYPEWGLGKYIFDTNVYNSCDNNYAYSVRDYNRSSTYIPPVDVSGNPSYDSNTVGSCRPWDYTYTCRIQGPNYLIDPEQDTDWYSCNGRYNIPDFGEGNYILSLESTDCLGNSTSLTYEYKLDNYSPNHSESISVEYCTNTNGWVNSNAIINIDCIDNGSGCNSIKYYIDDNSTSIFKSNEDLVENDYNFSINNNLLSLDTANIFGSDGNWGIRYILEDNLGNTSDIFELNFCIDTMEPVIDLNVNYNTTYNFNPYVDNNQMIFFDIDKVTNSDINKDTISVGIKNITLADLNYHTRIGSFSVDNNCNIINGKYNCIYNELDLNYDSDYNILVQAIDYAGNVNSKILTITYNNLDNPDVNISYINSIDIDDANYFSYYKDGNLTIDFNIIDYEPNGISLDLNYSLNDVFGYGNIIVNDFNLNLESCNSNITNQVNNCHVDFNIVGIDTNNYYLLVLVKSILYPTTSYSTYIKQIMIDNTKPTLSSNYAGNWKTSDFNLEFTCIDIGSGCDNINYILDFNPSLDINYLPLEAYSSYIEFPEDGNYTIDVNYYDRSGNIDSNMLNILIDKTNPFNTTSGCEVGISNMPEPIQINCDDLTSGCKSVYYSLDGNTYLEYSSQIMLDYGDNNLRYYSLDYAGNESDMNYLSCNIFMSSSGGSKALRYDIKIDDIIPNSEYFDTDLNQIDIKLLYNKSASYHDSNVEIYIRDNNIYYLVAKDSNIEYKDNIIVDINKQELYYLRNLSPDVNFMVVVKGYDRSKYFENIYYRSLKNNYYVLELTNISVSDIHANHIISSDGKYYVNNDEPFRIMFDINVNGIKIADKEYELKFYDYQRNLIVSYNITSDSKVFAKYFSFSKSFYPGTSLLNSKRIYYSLADNDVKYIDLEVYDANLTRNNNSEMYDFIRISYITHIMDDFVQEIKLYDINNNSIPNYSINISSNNSDFNVYTDINGIARFLVPDYGSYTINVNYSNGKTIQEKFSVDTINPKGSIIIKIIYYAFPYLAAFDYFSNLLK